ncbi:unnamed protein product [Paramecium pentaurelia]|uniref:Uncharacterized protein n=1 Tax=Paramecium pentaurelia TaxID=43138 RepID=A0A8S1WHS8_9CILI|nr:unnamed protein product [Paramecium pentaurelia]
MENFELAQDMIKQIKRINIVQDQIKMIQMKLLKEKEYYNDIKLKFITKKKVVGFYFYLIVSLYSIKLREDRGQDNIYYIKIRQSFSIQSILNYNNEINQFISINGKIVYLNIYRIEGKGKALVAQIDQKFDINDNFYLLI